MAWNKTGFVKMKGRGTRYPVKGFIQLSEIYKGRFSVRERGEEEEEEEEG